MCPTDTIFNPENERCEAHPTCPDGTIYNPETNDCNTISEPICTIGELNPETDQCESSFAPTCAGPGGYNTETNQCEGFSEPICEEGTLNPDTDECEGEEGDVLGFPECNSPFAYNPSTNQCEYFFGASCFGPGSATLNTSSDMCEETFSPQCFGPGNYNPTSDQCESFVNPFCPDPYSYNPSLNQCTLFGGDAICPDGTALDTEADVCALQTLHVDIKPGSDTNPINLKKLNGVIPVAVYGNAFDVSTLDDSTLVFEGAMPSHIQDGLLPEDHTQLVNEDEFYDKVSHYSLGETSITSGQLEGCLTAYTTDGIPAIGCDYIQTKN